ncbi:MAG TPA: potassium channel family protein, partial [Bryobacteraceae bacterium]|nr:potassium channel family protein [Bryobacteraceae bacterium]
MSRLHWRLLLVVAAFVLPLAMGTAGFILIDGFSFLDALYMSVITVATVGYFEVRELSDAARIFNIVLILFGVSMLLLAVGVMTQTIIELEFNRYFSRRRTKRMIDNLNNHYIVCGFGRVGRGAAEELRRAGVPVIILERSEEKVDRAMRKGMLAALGDATLDINLREVGIDRAAGLIAALSSDADNLYLVLSAKTLNPKLKISSRVIEEEAEAKMRRAGADTVLAPYTITGARLAQGILRPHVVQFLDFATIGLDVGIEQVRVADNSEYISKSLRQLALRKEVGV